MNKLIGLIFIIAVFSLGSMESYAGDLNESKMLVSDGEGEYITRGYTAEGVYYEVYGETTYMRSAECLTVTRTVVYDGDVIPNNSVYWTEEINGGTYAGTLFLQRYSYMSNQTTAWYTGNIYKK